MLGFYNSLYDSLDTEYESTKTVLYLLQEKESKYKINMVWVYKQQGYEIVGYLQ